MQSTADYRHCQCQPNLKTYLEETAKEIVHFNFDDHHFFEQHELENIRKNYPEFTNWITTEKDGVRLAFHKNWLLENNISLYCLPMKTRLIGNNAADFAETVRGFLDYFYKDEMVHPTFRNRNSHYNEFSQKRTLFNYFSYICIAFAYIFKPF
jgi:hypothetical protein